MIYIQKNEKFLFIWGQARCGSTTLAQIIQSDLYYNNLLIEPWSNSPMRYIHKKNLKENDIKINCKRLLKKNGVKELGINKNIEFAINFLKNKKIKFILLERKNILKQCISFYLGKETGSWDQRSDCYEKHLKNLVIKKNIIQNYLKFFKEQGKWINSCFDEENMIKIYYEDLYFNNFQNQIKKIKNKLNINFKLSKEKTKYFLETKRINDDYCYKLIKNIYDIEETFGNEENGYVFK